MSLSHSLGILNLIEFESINDSHREQLRMFLDGFQGLIDRTNAMLLGVTRQQRQFGREDCMLIFSEADLSELELKD